VATPQDRKIRGLPELRPALLFAFAFAFAFAFNATSDLLG
jgi:hypothetical protein